MDRRTLLRRGVSIAVVGLAGCAGDSDSEGPTASPTATEPAATTAGETPTEVPETASPTPTETEAMQTTTAAATTAAGDTPTATATGTPSPTPTTTVDADQVVEVGADNSLQFAPDSFQIQSGATVLWQWVAGGHNVRPDSIPEDSSWEGTPGGDSDTFDSGYTYSHTFEVAGEYEYYCGPHQGAGMVGSFTVE